MLTVIIVIGCVSGYCFMAGVTYAIAYARAAKRGSTVPGVDAVVPATLWPGGLPAIGGVLLVERIKAIGIPRAIVTKEQGE